MRCAGMHDRGMERWCVVAATEVWRDDMYVVMCDVAGTCEDGNCIELGCLTEVWKDGTCVVLCCVAGVWEGRVCVVLCCVTGVWEDGVCVVLCCVTGVWEDGVCAVLCCVTGVWEAGVCAVLYCVVGVWEAGVCAVLCCVAGVWEDDVVASPSPAGGKDANTASDKVAAVRFSAIVFFFLGGASGFVFKTTAFQMRDFVFIVTYSPIFMSPLTFFSLLILEADSRYSFCAYLDDSLLSYLIRIFSII